MIQGLNRIMNDRIKRIRDFFVVDKEHHAYRQPSLHRFSLAEQFEREDTPVLRRSVECARYLIEKEIPVVFPFEKIAITRTVPDTQEILTENEDFELRKKYWLHETGDLTNIAPDFMLVIGKGFNALKKEIQDKKKEYAENAEKVEFLRAMEEMISLMEGLAERYRAEAERVGNEIVAQTFSRIPAEPAESLLEAMQFFRLLHFCLWAARNFYTGPCRADQYLYPYYKNDIAAGLYDQQGALELVEEFFITFNRDSDLYPGVQQGDNGQSLVLGGLNEEGEDCYNELSSLMMQASLELSLIDPKVNLRINDKTSPELYFKATELTKQGLGFPQYLNDDINVPALLNWGYAPCDAYNYTVAACWELIIPGRGTDIPNADALSFPKVVLNTVMESLENCADYDEFEQAVVSGIRKEADILNQNARNLYTIPAPMISLFMDGCLENAHDAALGCKYCNIGFHGLGLSTAVDSIAAIRKFIFADKTITAKRLLDALKSDFDNDIELLNMLRYDAPKIGNDDDETDGLLSMLLDAFASALSGKKNDKGGIFRPGTASAMYYIWYGKELPATPDGRRNGEPLPCNYSPSLFTKTSGPISTIKSFTKPELTNVANGGPLTLELHDTVFKARDAIEKVAGLVQLFIHRGGHQLQLNAVNRDQMLEAQKTPSQYRNMIVRVWGWSGYFVELDKEYQDQIIQRTEYTI